MDLIVSVNSQERGICFDFLRGQCNRGLLCRFSHDLSGIVAQQSEVRLLIGQQRRVGITPLPLSSAPPVQVY